MCIMNTSIGKQVVLDPHLSTRGGLVATVAYIARVFLRYVLLSGAHTKTGKRLIHPPPHLLYPTPLQTPHTLQPLDG